MEFHKMLRGWKDVEEYPAQTILFQEAASADFLYIIMSGEVELTLRGEPLGTEKTGGIIGEMAIARSATRSSTAKALTDVKLARVDRDQLSVMMRDNSDFSLHVMAVLADRLRTVNQFITTHFKSG